MFALFDPLINSIILFSIGLNTKFGITQGIAYTVGFAIDFTLDIP